MGAKIHMHIEVKSSDTWYHYAAPSMFRDRVFFDLLGGIYNKEAAVVPPRGLPEDLSFVTKRDRGPRGLPFAPPRLAQGRGTLDSSGEAERAVPRQQDDAGA